MDYWNECISEAFEDAGINATKSQIDTVAAWVEGAHDNYGMANGYDVIHRSSNSEVEELKRKIKRLQENHEKQLRGIKEGVAQRRKISPQDVTIDDDGHIVYYVKF